MNNKINTIKDIMENDLLINNITEDLDDFDENAAVTYEVWAIGYDSDDDITDLEALLDDFTNPDEAVAYAKNITLTDVLWKGAESTGNHDFVFDSAYFSIEVETVVEDEDDCTMNIGTIYKKDIINEEFEDELIHLHEADFILDEDGNLTAACEHIGQHNKNDMIKIMFDDGMRKTIHSLGILPPLVVVHSFLKIHYSHFFDVQ